MQINLDQLAPQLAQEFLECRHNKEVLALMAAPGEQHETAKAMRTTGYDERRSIDGLGAPIAEINPTAFHYWGLRLGYKCWHDKQFMREFLRDNPAARVRAHGTKAQFGYTGGLPGNCEVLAEGVGSQESGVRKFSKTYSGKTESPILNPVS